MLDTITDQSGRAARVLPTGEASPAGLPHGGGGLEERQFAVAPLPPRGGGAGGGGNPRHVRMPGMCAAVAVLFSLLAPTALLAQAAARGFTPELDASIQRAMEEWQVPGLAIAVVRNDSVLVAKGYGVRELGKPGRVDAHTVFDIASLSKSFTAAGAAVLVDEGKLAWDDPVRRHLPWMEFPDAYLTREVTLRDLLSHRTGLEAANFMFRFTGYDRREMLSRVRWMRPQAPFRTQLVYNNILYAAAGEVSAAAAGTSWAELVRSRLLTPLGMTESYFDRAPYFLEQHVAASYLRAGEKLTPQPFDFDTGITTSNSGLKAPITDMVKYARFLIGDSANPVYEVVLKRSSLEEAWTGALPATEPGFGPIPNRLSASTASAASERAMAVFR